MPLSLRSPLNSSTVTPFLIICIVGKPLIPCNCSGKLSKRDFFPFAFIPLS